MSWAGSQFWDDLELVYLACAAASPLGFYPCHTHFIILDLFHFDIQGTVLGLGLQKEIAKFEVVCLSPC